MYLEQPSSPKPKMFHNIQHFWSQSECVMLKQLSKELNKHEGKVHNNKNKSEQTNSVRSVDVYPIPMEGDFIHLYQMIYDAIREANGTGDKLKKVVNATPEEAFEGTDSKQVDLEDSISEIENEEVVEDTVEEEEAVEAETFEL